MCISSACCLKHQLSSIGPESLWGALPFELGCVYTLSHPPHHIVTGPSLQHRLRVSCLAPAGVLFGTSSLLGIPVVHHCSASFTQMGSDSGGFQAPSSDSVHCSEQLPELRAAFRAIDYRALVTTRALFSTPGLLWQNRA